MTSTSLCLPYFLKSLRRSMRTFRTAFHPCCTAANSNHSGNVGLSLGYPTVDTGFSGVFNTFSKTVICLLMLRGRHRGMPSRIDRAIMLPGDLVINEHLLEEPADKPRFPDRDLSKMKRYHTS